VPTWKLIVEYDGTKFSGWQEQRNARTIQGALREAAEDLFGAAVEIQGAGRTDAGVHAIAQTAHLRVRRSTAMSPEQMVRALNERLPASIAVLEVARERDHFHARHDAITRTYLYQISLRKTAFSKRFVWWVKEPLDVKAMARAARMIVGRHDFVCFRAADAARPDESTIVVVESAEVGLDGDMVVFRIEASHFLWRMVRRLVGALVKLGKGEITMADFEQLLDGRCSPALDVAAWTAPASGLLLESVRYPSDAKADAARRKKQ
jgi:tRNA pseudouridine38-40 synthase